MQPPHTVLLDHRAHVYCWESGALPALSQASVSPVIPTNGIHLTLNDVKKNMVSGDNREYLSISAYSAFRLKFFPSSNINKSSWVKNYH